MMKNKYLKMSALRHNDVSHIFENFDIKSVANSIQRYLAIQIGFVLNFLFDHCRAV